MSKWILVSESQNAIKYAVQQERERIIKLLEEMRDACLGSDGNIGEHNAWTLENAIIFIKGEQK
jgi:hypothetical protein